MALTKFFSAANPNFWVRLVIFVLTILASLGVNFPSNPDVLGPDIVTTLSSGSIYAIIAVMGLSVLMPIINFFRASPRPNFWEFLGSPNTWIYVATFIAGLLIMIGINIPEGTGAALVGAIYAKDWAALISIAATNILDPLIRWWKDKGAAQAT